MSPLNNPSQLGNPRLRVLLADGTQVSGNQFTEALQALNFVEIVGSVKTSDQALDLFFKLRPQALVVSIILPKQDGMEVLRCIKRAAPNCDVILLSHAPNTFLEQAGSLLGATGLCSVHDGVDQLQRLLYSCWQRRFVGSEV
ncbi:MAG TPA: response regulator [Candidatus Limnocylindrales bacterium]|jgi:DNA-binding NarL/FixJ family response regulator|nr:response regulator [Candidatus Limnocylindrales bacterium]